jgi:hypothetical protein
MDGREENAKWISGSMCSLHFLNRKAVIATMPEWLAVKVGFIPTGALAFGGINDKFKDDKPFRQPADTNSGTNE